MNSNPIMNPFLHQNEIQIQFKSNYETQSISKAIQFHYETSNQLKYNSNSNPNPIQLIGTN